MVIYAFNPSTLEAEARRSLIAPGQSGLHRVGQASQDYIVRLHLEKPVT